MTFLGVSKKFTICQEAKQVNTKQNLHFECLEPHHFVPEIVETYPYEQLSHAVLNWVEENADRCDVIHGHEWGGAFVDLITANNHRQVCSGSHLYGRTLATARHANDCPHLLGLQSLSICQMSTYGSKSCASAVMTTKYFRARNMQACHGLHTCAKSVYSRHAPIK